MSRVLLLDGGKPVDVFDVVELTSGLARVRSPFLFEVGEELSLRIDDAGTARDVQARVIAHAGSADDKLTVLELR